MESAARRIRLVVRRAPCLGLGPVCYANTVVSEAIARSLHPTTTCRLQQWAESRGADVWSRNPVARRTVVLTRVAASHLRQSPWISSKVTHLFPSEEVNGDFKVRFWQKPHFPGIYLLAKIGHALFLWRSDSLVNLLQPLGPFLL